MEPAAAVGRKRGDLRGKLPLRLCLGIEAVAAADPSEGAYPVAHSSLWEFSFSFRSLLEKEGGRES